MIGIQKIYVFHGLNRQNIEKSWDVTPVTDGRTEDGGGGGGKWKIEQFSVRPETAKIHSHNSETRIRGFHSQEWMGTGTPAYPWMVYNSPICLLVIFNCYESCL